MTTIRALVLAACVAVLLSPMLWAQRGSFVGTMDKPAVAGGIDNDVACTECTLWVNGQNAGASENDSDSDGDCDEDDTTGSAGCGTDGYRTHDNNERPGDTDLTRNNQPAIYSTVSTPAAEDPLQVFAMTAENDTNGDYWKVENSLNEITDNCEGRWAVVLYQREADINENHFSTAVAGGDRVFFNTESTTKFSFNIDYSGAGNVTATSTTDLTLDRWYMLEGAYCDDECATACSITDDSVAIYVNGTQEDITTDNSMNAIETAGDVALGRVTAANLTVSTDTVQFALFAIADDDAVDFWDRYAGACSGDGTTRCIEDADCSGAGGTCSDPAPRLDLPTGS